MISASRRERGRLDQKSQILALRDVASQINSGGDLQTVLQHLIAAACRHAHWSLGSIMGIDAAHGYAYVIVRYDPTLIERQLPDRWELATSPSLIALQRNEPVYIRDARETAEFPGYRKEAFERDYRTVVVILDIVVARDFRVMGFLVMILLVSAAFLGWLVVAR